MILQSLKMAVEAIFSNKMRSFLTMLGIIIGVVALVVMVSLVNGTSDAVTDEINSFGNDMVTVSILDDKGAPLRLEDLAAIQKAESISQIAPSSSMQAKAKRGYADCNVTVYGTTAAYCDIQGLELQMGRFLKTTDVDNASNVAVLSYDAAEDLFGGEDPLGKSFSLNGRSFLAVGVLEEEDSMMSMMFGGAPVYVPFTVGSRMAGRPYVTSLYLSATGSTDAAEADIRDHLLERFHQDEDAFLIVNMSTVADIMATVTDLLSLLLGGIAAISLLVGGIGIMNIMLVSVTERTKEIGIRKAIGASRRSILVQFLLEALMLSLIGCMLGLLLSFGILELISYIAEQIHFSMSLEVVFLSVSFASAIGLIFGIYPANKAAGKHPIEALRYEG